MKLVISPHNRRKSVLEVINAARQSLIFSLFRCDDFSVLEAVAAAVRRKVRVEALITGHRHSCRGRLDEVASLLKSAGVQVSRYSPNIKYHAKYMVADDETALITSLNFTHACFENTCDFMVISHDAEVMAGLNAVFDADCKSAGASLPCITDELIVGPDQARTRFTALLEAARARIRIIDRHFNDRQILSLLDAKAKSGVTVQVLGGAIPDFASHGSLFLVDDRLAVIGSTAFSTRSLDSRRELSLLIRDVNAVRELDDFFSRLFKTFKIGLPHVKEIADAATLQKRLQRNQFAWTSASALETIHTGVDCGYRR